MAAFARKHEVGHELHLDGDGTFAFTFFASSAVGVEAEVGRRVAHLLGKRQGSKELANFVPRFDVGDGIGACALADGVLVDELDGADHVQVSLQPEELAGTVGHFVELPLHRIVEDVADKAALAASADACDAGHYAKREAYVDTLQVVGTCSFYLDEAI